MRSRNNLLKEKKGSTRIYFLLLTLVIAAIIIVMTINVAVKYSESKSYQLNFYAQDVSLLLDAVQAVPGDIILYYPLIDDFFVSLRKNEVEVIHEPTGMTKTKQYHLLPGLTVEPRVMEKLLVISKQGDKLSITDQPLPAAQPTCPSFMQLDPANLAINVITQPAPPNSPLTDAALDLIKRSFENSLGVTRNTKPGAVSMTIIIAAIPSTDDIDSVIVERPQATGALENDYQRLYCVFAESLQGKTTAAIRERIIINPSTGYNIKMTFTLTPDHKILNERVAYADAFAKALKEANP